MRLLDEGGLRALTLRSVAQQVGVAPASLYSRVESVDDLFDLALDTALADDPVMSEAVRAADLPALMHAFFEHLTTHRWAGQVIGMRAPRGPAYLALSERMCVLLEQAGTPDPLGPSTPTKPPPTRGSTPGTTSARKRSWLMASQRFCPDRVSCQHWSTALLIDHRVPTFGDDRGQCLGVGLRGV